MTTLIKNIMTTNVITVNENTIMTEIGDIFETNNIHHIPVIDESKKLVGILSKHDYNMMLTTSTLFKTSRSETLNDQFKKSLLASEVMSKNVVSLSLDTPVSIAVGIFNENLFHAMPIVDVDKKVVGILTTYDLLNHAYGASLGMVG